MKRGKTDGDRRPTGDADGEWGRQVDFALGVIAFAFFAPFAAVMAVAFAMEALGL